MLKTNFARVNIEYTIDEKEFFERLKRTNKTIMEDNLVPKADKKEAEIEKIIDSEFEEQFSKRKLSTFNKKLKKGDIL